MKKFSVILMIMTMMSAMSCENSKKNNAGAADKAAAEEVAPVAAAKSKVVVVARAAVKEGQEAAFIDVAKVLVEATRKEPGCLFYALYQSPLDPRSFIFYEEYKDDASFAAHSGSGHFKIFADAIPDMLAGELVVDRF
jgi:quinol monooxygenase YgiN